MEFSRRNYRVAESRHFPRNKPIVTKPILTDSLREGGFVIHRTFI
jgi:hypothetical protein